jgi:peroxiredoxin
MRSVKRNQWVIVLVVAAFALMVWSGYENYKRRKQYAQHQLQGTLTPETANNQSVQQDVSADEGLPDLRGKSAPEFTLRNVEGKKVSLSDYKGKAVLINFWATWCAPCKIEMPWLVALRNEYAPQGFEILGVNADDPGTPRAKLVKFGQEQHLDYPLLVGEDSMSRKYGGVEFLPTSFFVGRNGKVVAETAGLVSKDEVETSIKKALAAGAK